MITTNKTKKTEVKPKDVQQTKVIVRLLPPTLTLEKFLEEVAPLPEYSYLNYVPADKGLGQFSYCRAVIGFKKADDVFIFTEKFDGYVFVDAKGSDYPAVVEYAPYQRVPLSSRRHNAKEGTIEEDVDYKKFVEQLENPAPQPVKTVQDTMEEMDAQAKLRHAAHTDTPLLVHMNKLRQEKRLMQERMREEKRRVELKRKKRREEERRLKLEETAVASSKSMKSAKSYDEEVTVVTIPRGGKSSESKGSKKAGGQSKQATDKHPELKPAGERSPSKQSADKPGKKPDDRPKSSDDKNRPKERFERAKLRAASGRPERQASGRSERQGFKEYSRHDAKPKEKADKDGKAENADKTPVGAEKSDSKPKVTEMSSSSPTKDTTAGEPMMHSKPKIKLTSRDYDGVEVRTIERKAREKPSSTDSSTSEAVRSDGDKSGRRKKPERAIYNPAQRAAERRAKQSTAKPEGSATQAASDAAQ